MVPAFPAVYLEDHTVLSYGELAELAGEFEAAGKIQRWRLAPYHENGATPK